MIGCQRCRELEAERDALLGQLDELNKLTELQAADLDRYKKAAEAFAPNHPERVPPNQLQLAFERILEGVADLEQRSELMAAVGHDRGSSQQDDSKKKRKKTNGGRRNLNLENLPVEEIRIDPDDVVAAGAEGFVALGEEVSERIAFRPGMLLRLRIVRTKWMRKDPSQDSLQPITTAELPESVWPDFMADPSVIAQIIVAKYDDSLPLHRQELITARNGFAIPRSTQCGWLKEAHAYCARVADAMMADAVASAFCIATDATGAPVRGPGRSKRENWQMFVFIADGDHVVFRYAESGTAAAVASMLDGFCGYVLADAAKIFDSLFTKMGMTEVACWFHLRRYFYKAIGSDPQRAYEALSLISKLFKINRQCMKLAEPERTRERSKRAQPVLRTIDQWVEDNRDQADPRGPLDKAIGYYTNQRKALHRFRDEGRLRLDNNLSEQALRKLVVGRNNYGGFENETGLKWYAAFRTLIASCALHKLNPQDYLQKLLRLTPHWPVNRVLELAPKYWNSTLGKLSERQRVIIEPPWQRAWPTVATPRSTAAA